MAIEQRLVQQKGEACFVPVLICDQCGRRIRRAREAGVVWQDGLAGGAPEGRRVYFLHEWCGEAFSAAHPDEQWRRDELSVFILYLGHNLRVDWPGGRKNTGFVARL